MSNPPNQLLERLESLVSRRHEILKEIEAIGNVKRGTDEALYVKSLKREQKFVERESRNMVSKELGKNTPLNEISSAVDRSIRAGRNFEAPPIIMK